MAGKPLSPAIFVLESIQDREHFRNLGMPSLYSRVETLLERGIPACEFRKMDPSHGVIHIIGLGGFYYLAAGNFPQAGKAATL
jgi:hypothetical protein